MEQTKGANEYSKFEVENLNLHYGDFHALKDINMKIEEHETPRLSDLPDAENQRS